MKIIFLDVDGVLNNNKTNTRNPLGFIGVDDTLCQRLREIVVATGAKIVLSSAWRQYPESLPYLWEHCGPTVECVGQTDYYPNKYRGDEIAAWLAEHPEVDKFVILDDRTDMGDLKQYLVQTYEDTGMTEKEKELAIKMLNG